MCIYTKLIFIERIKNDKQTIKRWLYKTKCGNTEFPLKKKKI